MEHNNMNASYQANPVVQTPNVARIIDDAKAALRQGDRERAYRLSLEATRINPQDVQSWLMRARTAASQEEVLHSLSQVHRIDPHHPIAKDYTYQALWQMLDRDPFLAYLDETDELYYVRSQEYLSLAVPKDRAVPEVYPTKERPPLAPAYRMLIFSVIGLLAAGLGTFVFAPLTILAALAVQRRKNLSNADRMRSRVVIFLAFLMLGPAILLGLLFVVHIRG